MTLQNIRVKLLNELDRKQKKLQNWKSSNPQLNELGVGFMKKLYN